MLQKLKLVRKLFCFFTSWKWFGNLDFCNHVPGVRNRYKALKRMQERQTVELNNAFHLHRQKYSNIWEIQQETWNTDMRKEEICLLKRVNWKLAATQCQQVSVPMNQPLEFSLCGPATLSLHRQGLGPLRSRVKSLQSTAAS